jgi:hypothetical protein
MWYAWSSACERGWVGVEREIEKNSREEEMGEEKKWDALG